VTNDYSIVLLLQVVRGSILQLYKRSTFILLIPLLVFNGFEQGFIYSDYTKVCSVFFFKFTLRSSLKNKFLVSRHALVLVGAMQSTE